MVETAGLGYEPQPCTYVILTRAFKGIVNFRWPPHINLIYPFVADRSEDLQKAAAITSDVLTAFKPFEVRRQVFPAKSKTGVCFLNKDAFAAAYAGRSFVFSTPVELHNLARL